MERLLSYYYWYFAVKGLPYELLHTMEPQQALKVRECRAVVLNLSINPLGWASLHVASSVHNPPFFVGGGGAIRSRGHVYNAECVRVCVWFRDSRKLGCRSLRTTTCPSWCCLEACTGKQLSTTTR